MGSPQNEGQRYRIVVVDDDRQVVSLLVHQLHDQFEITAFTSPVSALEHLLAEESPDVVLCDVSMPQLEGPALARRAVVLRPELAGAFVFMTGGEEREIVVAQGWCPILRKPVERKALVDQLTLVAAGRSRSTRGGPR